MSDDFLDRATKALRKEGEASPEDLRRLRSRVTEGVRVQQRRRSRLWTAAFPIAAVLVATTAWAAGTGRLGAAMRGVRALFVPETTVVATAPAPVAAPPKPLPLPVPVPEPVEAPPPPPPESVPPPAPIASAPAAPIPSAKPSVAPSVAVEPEPAPTPAVEDAGTADLALYKRAHKLHFVDKDPAAALGAWDEYLKASPGGAFVAEARYNRAICLVKLGRKAEAKAALQPFADGTVAGGYRKDDARKLIEALEAP